MNRDNRRLRLVFALLVVTSLTLLTADLRGGKGGAFGAVRSAAGSVFNPIGQGVSNLVRPIGNAISAAVHSGRDQKTIAMQKREIIQLQYAADHDVELKADRAELQKLGVLETLSDTTGVFANVTAHGDAVDNYQQTVTLDVGTIDRIQDGQPVISVDGLIGKVVRVYKHSSVVELLDDPESSVGVDVGAGKTSLTATVSGQGPGMPLSYTQLIPATQLKAGTSLYTSQGSQYDKGIPVGKLGATRLAQGGTEQVGTVAPFANVDAATVVDVLLTQSLNAPRAVLKPQPAPKASPSQAKPTPTGTPTPPAGATSGPSSVASGVTP